LLLHQLMDLELHRLHLGFVRRQLGLLLSKLLSRNIKRLLLLRLGGVKYSVAVAVGHTAGGALLSRVLSPTQ